MEEVPIRIGRYVVESLVGAGGMGQIYKAHDPDIRRTVAIKLISTRLMGSADRAEYIRRFRREAQAAARCAHPNIIAIYDFALHEDQPFLAMEFVYGPNVRQLLSDGALSVSDAIDVIVQVLDALATAHEHGVIHQDIKPANIMLTPQRRAKVADFGISRFANTDVTSVSSSMGTPNYMSPEQCRGGPVDARSDLFSVGVTLFEMVSGVRAFSGATAAEVAHRILNDRLPLLPAPVRSAAPRLQFVLERATGKHPEDRFESSQEMAEALRHLRGDSGDPAAGTAAPDLSTVVAKAPAADSARQPGVGPPALQALERTLAGYVGPIARILVRDAAARGSPEALVAALVAAVPAGPERERFRREATALVPLASLPTETPTGTGPPSSFDAGELARVEQALTHHVGPVARVLVRRAARTASSVEALWQVLAEHIDAPAEKTAFLRRRLDG